MSVSVSVSMSVSVSACMGVRSCVGGDKAVQTTTPAPTPESLLFKFGTAEAVVGAYTLCWATDAASSPMDLTRYGPANSSFGLTGPHLNQSRKHHGAERKGL